MTRVPEDKFNLTSQPGHSDISIVIAAMCVQSIFKPEGVTFTDMLLSVFPSWIIAKMETMEKNQCHFTQWIVIQYMRIHDSSLVPLFTNVTFALVLYMICSVDPACSFSSSIWDISRARWTRHLTGKNSNLSSNACSMKRFQLGIATWNIVSSGMFSFQTWSTRWTHVTEQNEDAFSCIYHNKKSKIYIILSGQLITCISSIVMRATEQWLRATKSMLTPNVPAHRRSPATAQSPTESLPWQEQSQSLRQISSTISWVISLKGKLHMCQQLVTVSHCIMVFCTGKCVWITGVAVWNLKVDQHPRSKT